MLTYLRKTISHEIEKLNFLNLKTLTIIAWPHIGVKPQYERGIYRATAKRHLDLIY